MNVGTMKVRGRDLKGMELKAIDQSTDLATLQEVTALSRMSLAELREKYLHAFGDVTRSTHKRFLIRRLAWRIQELAEGGLSERARRRAEELANDGDLRLIAPGEWRVKSGSSGSSEYGGAPASATPGLPPPGTILAREFQGRDVIVKILHRGVEHDGKTYRSLSAVAQEVTGTKWNGPAFFGLRSGRGVTR